jgi:hypothetical protein
VKISGRVLLRGPELSGLRDAGYEFRVSGWLVALNTIGARLS